MFDFKANRFYFFIVGYTALFTALAFFGAEEVTRFRAERMSAAKEAEERLDAFTKNKSLYQLPRLDITMATSEGASHHVRLDISLEMDKKKLEEFDSYQPRVSDRIVNFLGQQDIDKFQGINGMDNLRRHLLFEVNKASGPVPISDVIFREFIVR